MSNDYVNKVLEEKDVLNLRSVFKSAFGVNVGAELIRKKYFSPYQKLHLSYISYYKKTKAASFYGMICQKAICRDEVFYIGQSCDSMTHKEHGGKGLFVDLANNVYTNAKNKGIDFIYGFPNTTIYDLRIKKLKWQHKENINVFQVEIGGLPLAKIAKKVTFLNGIYNSYLKHFFLKHESKKEFFANSVLNKSNAGILHDEAYFKYKDSINKFILEIESIKFWVKIDGFLWVGDFENSPLENFNKAFIKLKELAKRIGGTSIVFHYQEGTSNDELLKQIIGVKQTMPVGFINLTDESKNKVFKFSGSDFDSW